MKFILACSTDHIIGIGNQLPWKIKDEYQYFLTQTKDGAILCGRKTSECFRSFSNWSSVHILSRNHPIVLEELDESVWCIGGCSLYNRIAELKPSEVYLTYIGMTYLGGSKDTIKLSQEFFTELESSYRLVNQEDKWLWDSISKSEIKCSFNLYKRMVNLSSV